MSDRRPALLAAAYYLLLGLLLVLVVTRALPHLLPLPVARHVGSDSEGYLLALLLPAWLQYARPRLSGRADGWVVTLAAAVLLFAGFLVLYLDHGIVGTVRTLNETSFALALLLPYAQPRRRPGVAAAVGLGVLLAAAVVLLGHTPLAHLDTALAEGTVMVLLAPLVLDAVDRDVLGSGSLPWRGRAVLLVVLAVVPLTVIALRHAGLPGWLHDGIGYAARAQEAFVGMWLVVAYLGVHRSLQRSAPGTALDEHPRLAAAA